MRFWDSSAIVPLVVQEDSSSWLFEILQKDSEMLVWWSSEVECVSALARIEREDHQTSDVLKLSLERLDTLATSWYEVEPSVVLREIARRLLRTHSLRAADALQLAAAIQAAEGRPSSLEFVCLDSRLAEAAEREGFEVISSSPSS